MARMTSRWDRVRRVGRWATHGLLYPLLALIVIVFVGAGMPAAIDAAQGEGRAGTFTAEDRSCAPVRLGGEQCSWYGSFVSSDGVVRLTGVLLDVDTPQRAGDQEAVLYQGETDPPKVYPAEGSRDWLWGLALLVLAGGYLAWSGWRVLRTRAPAPAG